MSRHHRAGTSASSFNSARNRDNARRKVKLTLYTITSLASLLAISLFAATIPEWNANFFHAAGPIRGDWTDGLALGPLGLTFLSTAAMLLYTLVMRRPPSPTNATTALYAVILVLLAPALVLSGVASLFRFWQPDAVSQSGAAVQCNLTNIFTRQCEPVLYQVGAMQIAGLVFGSITWLLVLVALLVHLYEQRAMSSVTMDGRPPTRSQRRRQQDLEKGRLSDRARYGDCRSWAIRSQYRAASRQGGQDVVPFAIPESTYHTRYM